MKITSYFFIYVLKSSTWPQNPDSKFFVEAGFGSSKNESGSFTLVRNPYLCSYVEFSATQHKLLVNLLGTGKVGFSWRVYLKMRVQRR